MLFPLLLATSQLICCTSQNTETDKRLATTTLQTQEWILSWPLLENGYNLQSIKNYVFYPAYIASLYRKVTVNAVNPTQPTNHRLLSRDSTNWQWAILSHYKKCCLSSSECCSKWLSLSSPQCDHIASVYIVQQYCLWYVAIHGRMFCTVCV